MEQLTEIVDRLQEENEKRAAEDPGIKKSVEIVEEFLKSNKVLCYGGTAINNLLPEKERFYRKGRDIPDYDFFSVTPQEHAMALADKLHKSGVEYVEVKPGVHFGTFKVFANFEGIADVTQLEKKIFNKLWQNQVSIEGIHYVTPNFLRMSMYLELSRPRGDVSRWVKIFTRLRLLNKHYPIYVKAQNEIMPKPLDPEYKKKVVKYLTREPVVLLGINAGHIMAKQRTTWNVPATLLAEKETIEKLTKGETVRKHPESDILPPSTEVLDNHGRVVIRFFETVSCHSYHKAGGIRVASIPTILQFFFAFIYTDAPDNEIIDMMVVGQRLMEIANKKSSRRFAILTPIDCLGEQKTLAEIKREKAEVYVKLSRNKSSPEFLKYFFTYDPSDSKTRRQKKRDLLRKTRKTRSEL